jgi:hemolysin activation/secretion protein
VGRRGSQANEEVSRKAGAMKLRAFLTCCVALQATVAAISLAWAQSAPPNVPFGIGDAVRESNESRRAPLPRAPAALVLPHLVEPQFMLKDKETLFVRSLKVEGSNLVDDAEVRGILAPYENRKLTLAKIFEAADKITTLYREHGYLVASAYVPAQDARRGVLRIKVVPGRYGAITIKNSSLVRDDYLQAVVDHAFAGSRFIHQAELERAMLEIYDLPGAGMPRAAIAAGRQPETTDFQFGVPEARRFDGYLLGDNFGAPFVGRDRLSGGLNVNSPLGYGDRLSAFGIISQDSGIVNGRAAYSFPIGYDGLRAEVAAYRTTYVLGGTFAGLDATGTANAVTGTLTYPILRGRDDSVYISGNYSHKMLNDNILGISIADRKLDSGTAAITRDTVGTLIGLPLTTNTNLAFTAGRVNFPDPTQLAANVAGPDTAGDYEKVDLTFTATLALAEKLSLSTHFSAQKSLSGNLDSSEQMSLTGIWGVRSFDEGLSGDSGYLVTPELKYALPDIYAWHHSIGLFTDVGAVWLANASFTTTQKSFTQLNDIGLGYYGTYEYTPGRFWLLKAMVAHTYGSDNGAQTYDARTKGLVQVGFTF